MMDRFIDIVSEHFAWFVGVSVLVFILSVWLASYLIVRIPPEYFVTKHSAVDRFAGLPLVVRWIVFIAKQLVGLILLLVGILMLVAPGQGVLTILAGIMLIDFPGKRKSVFWLVRRRGVLKTLNWVRRRAGAPPLVLDR